MESVLIHHSFVPEKETVAKGVIIRNKISQAKTSSIGIKIMFSAMVYHTLAPITRCMFRKKKPMKMKGWNWKKKKQLLTRVQIMKIVYMDYESDYYEDLGSIEFSYGNPHQTYYINGKEYSTQ